MTTARIPCPTCSASWIPDTDDDEMRRYLAACRGYWLALHSGDYTAANRHHVARNRAELQAMFAGGRGGV